MNESNRGQGARRMLAAEHFVMRSRGEPFTLTAFMHALKIPRSSAHHYLSWLIEENVIVQDVSTSKYCMSTSFRNMLVATGLSLVALKERVS